MVDMQVLLVEDDPALALMVKKRLEHLKHLAIEVVVVTSLRAAVEWLATAKPDVVLLDLNLPDSSGVETLDAVLLHAMATPVVVASATGDRNMHRIAMQRGAYDYVEKGKFDPTEVAHRLVEAVVAHASESKKTKAIRLRLSDAVEELENPNSSRSRLKSVKCVASELHKLAETK